jgi:hypothetical protein
MTLIFIMQINTFKSFQRICPSPRPCVTFHKKLASYGDKLLSSPPSLQAGEPQLVSCPWLLVQYIFSYLPHLEAVSSTHNLRICHAVVTGTHIMWNVQMLDICRLLFVLHNMRQTGYWILENPLLFHHSMIEETSVITN